MPWRLPAARLRFGRRGAPSQLVVPLGEPGEREAVQRQFVVHVGGPLRSYWRGQYQLVVVRVGLGESARVHLPALWQLFVGRVVSETRAVVHLWYQGRVAYL